MAPITTVCDARSSKESESDEEMKILFIPKIQHMRRQFIPLAVVFVGLPATGKTKLCRKLNNYLNWIQHQSKVFSVSEYRRKHLQLFDSFNLFRPDNKEGLEIRNTSMMEAHEDAVSWLKGGGDVAILDGVYASKSLRQKTYHLLHEVMGFKVLFVECICNDEQIVNANVKEILQYNTDYSHLSKDKAFDSIQRKIRHYRSQYQTLDGKADSKYSYIKIFNGGESVSTNRMDGPLQRDVLTYVSYVQRSSTQTFYFSRHGESEYNISGKIGGDTNLSKRGKLYAIALARFFNDAAIPDLHIWTSQKKRTAQTVQDIKVSKENVPALNELDAGICEGMSYEEMQVQYPQEFAWRDQDKLRYRYPWGESYVDIMRRLHPVLVELEREDNLLVVSHQAVLRCILGYFLNKEPEELPYINVPLHTVIKVTARGYEYKMETIKLNVECVDTYRKQPKDVLSNDENREKRVPFLCGSIG